MSNSLQPHGLYSPWNSPCQTTGVGSLSLLQCIFLTQESNQSLLHCRWILYQLSHQRRPRILQWDACPFSSGSSQPRNRTRVSCIAGIFFTNWAIREASIFNVPYSCRARLIQLLWLDVRATTLAPNPPTGPHSSNTCTLVCSSTADC